MEDLPQEIYDRKLTLIESGLPIFEEDARKLAKKHGLPLEPLEEALSIGRQRERDGKPPLIRGLAERAFPTEGQKEYGGKRDFTTPIEGGFMLTGEFRIEKESYHGLKLRPELKPEGGDKYAPLDELIPEGRLHKCYELTVRSPHSTLKVDSGYLHRAPDGLVSFGAKGIVREGQNPMYFNSRMIWSNLLDDNHEPIVEGPVELIFKKKSPKNPK